MKIPKLVVPVLLLLAVSLSCKLFNKGDSGGVSSDKVNRIATNLPTFNPNASDQVSQRKDRRTTLPQRGRAGLVHRENADRRSIR